MEVLLGVQVNINHFYEIKRKIDKILSQNNLTLTSRYKLDTLRYELLQYLSDILSVKCEGVLSTSFYMQVNNVESKIVSLLSIKEQEMLELENSRKEALEIVKKIVSLIYSIDVLKNSIHIRVNPDNILLDIKTKVEKISRDNKRVYAINYMISKLDNYKEGMISLLDIISLYKEKNQIPLDKKQEILDIFNTISLENQYAKNRKNIFAKDLSSSDDSKYSIEYLKSYEQIFIDCCDYIDVKLTSFYDKIKEIVLKEDVSKTHLLNCIDFIHKKYYRSIIKEYEKIEIENQALYSKIREDLISLYSYDGMTILENILNDINSKKQLPSYLQNCKFKDYIQNILFDFELSVKDDIEIYDVIDELNENLLKKFNFKKYLELFELNTTKIRQISEFRQYYITLLEESKEDLIKQYIIRLEESLREHVGYIYNTHDENIKIKEKQKQINLLREALLYINENYRKFDKKNLKIYIDTLEKKYELPNLYQQVIKKKSYLTNKVRLRSIIKKENICIGQFIEKEDIANGLMNNIIENIITDDDELKNEIINFVNLNKSEKSKDFELENQGFGKYKVIKVK